MLAVVSFTNRMWGSLQIYYFSKSNLKTALVGQRLRPSQAGLCAVAAWSAVAFM